MLAQRDDGGDALDPYIMSSLCDLLLAKRWGLLIPSVSVSSTVSQSPREGRTGGCRLLQLGEGISKTLPFAMLGSLCPRVNEHEPLQGEMKNRQR